MTATWDDHDVEDYDSGQPTPAAQTLTENYMRQMGAAWDDPDAAWDEVYGTDDDA